MAERPSIQYPVAERAIRKWSAERLERIDDENGQLHLLFRYRGSTCTNGGSPFEAHLHVRVGSWCAPQDAVVESAWIEIPDNQRGPAGAMCAAVRDGGFFDRLAEPAEFSGSRLEEVILEDVPVNYAGCFCAPPMVNEKWKLALSTVHYALATGALPT